MAAADTDLTRVRVSATSGGTYTNVGYVRGHDLTEGEEGGGVTRYYGGELSKAGEPTLEASLDILYDRADTLGQEIIRTAKRAGTTVWLQFCPNGTATGAKVDQFEATVTEIAQSGSRDDDYVGGTLSFRGIPSTLTTITLA
jgi:hypothetical protein